METMKDDMSDRMNDYHLDFGEDADGPMPADPAFDAWVGSVAPSVNAPPSAPRGDMWNAIQSAQRASAAANPGAIPGILPLPRRRWILPASIAATLVLGVAIGRLALHEVSDAGPTRTAVRNVAPSTAPVTPELPATARPESGPSANSTNAQSRRVASAPSSAAATRDPSRLYRLAAVQTLSQAEALLTTYKATAPAGRSDPSIRQLGTWGREVLSSTRLLIDSPAGNDPELRQLLNDLELVLVQIIQLSGAPLDASDRALIDRALRDHDLLPRIRTAVPAGVTGTASDD
jgi:hypothetical protein